MKSIAHNFGACSVKTDFGFSAEDLQKDDHDDYKIKESVSTFNDLEYTIIAKIMEGVGYFNCCQFMIAWAGCPETASITHIGENG